MGVPISYNQLTVREYVKVKEIEMKHSDLLDRRMALVSHFTNKNAENLDLNVLKWQLFKVDSLLASQPSTKVKHVIWINGRRYKTFADVTKLSKVQTKLIVDQAVTAKELAKNGQGDINLHRLLGLIYLRAKIGTTPEFDVKTWDDISEDMLDVTIGEVYGAVFFYSNVLEKLTPIIPYFLMEAEQTIENHMAEVLQWAATRGKPL
jgi:hypothetical protein